MKMHMSQNKITVLIGNQKLFDTLSEIITIINNQINIEFDLVFYDQKILISYPTIIADISALKLIEKNSYHKDIKKIYLINNSKNFEIDKKIESEIILIDMPIHINDFFERVANDVVQEFNQNRRIVNFQDYNYDFNARLLFHKNKSLRFTEKENEIFACLLNYNDKPISKKKLLMDIWQYDDQIDTHTLETHIYSLRKKLESKLGLKNFLKHLDKGYQLDTSLL